MTVMRSLILTLLVCGVAAGDTVVLKDGTFFEGTITIETSRSIRLDTRFGLRQFMRSEIAEIIPGGTTVEEDSDFASLSPAAREIRNAQVEYRLGQYDQALSRLEKLGKAGDDPGLQSQRDWLVIGLHQRMGQWDTARRLLNEKLEKGTPPERVRAQAHLDILKNNPQYSLQFVGDKHARHFIRDERLRDQARESGSMRDYAVMRAALEQYCTQLLAEDKLSVKAFSANLDQEVTYQAIVGAGIREDLQDVLPYKLALRNAEASLAKAQAILGDYGKAYELDLARLELDHLIQVSIRLYSEANQNSPENFTPAADPRSGRLTPDGRRQWQERCDEFLKRAQPLTRLLAYMKERVEKFPGELLDLHEFVTNVTERLDETIKSVKRARGRTHV